MRHTKIVLCMAAIAVCLLISIACEQDWLGGGYVRSSDRSKTFEPGIEGMVRWLDTPVPKSPSYSPGFVIGSAYSGWRSPVLLIGSAWSTPYYSYYYPYTSQSYWHYQYMPYNYWYEVMLNRYGL
ncbi:MAG: hypothetical protein MUO26_08300 [Methanotrichaceae archaeon]|nr:hypothetical protein [Methanotrichaceae archaeon]